MVLGAGLSGVTTAWYLTRAGFQVSLVDRQPGAGLETSFANGGQISISHPEPWANPGAPAQVLRWLGTRADAPLKFRPHRDLAQWTTRACVSARMPPARTATPSRSPRLRSPARQRLRALRRTRPRIRPARARHPAPVLHSRAGVRQAPTRVTAARLQYRLTEVLDRDACLNAARAGRVRRQPGWAGSSRRGRIGRRAWSSTCALALRLGGGRDAALETEG